MSAEILPLAPDLAEALSGSVHAYELEVLGRLPEWRAARDAVALQEAELEIHAGTRALADQITAHILRAIAADRLLQKQAAEAARQGCGRKLRSGGDREATVHLLGGGQVRIPMIYLKQDRRTGRGKKKNGKRGRTGTGMYPLLAALGVFEGVTPALAVEITRQVAESDSVRAGRAALARRGADLGHKETLRIVNRLGKRAVSQREKWLSAVTLAEPPTKSALAGKRVAVAIDGGRIRTRVALPGRKSTKTGHHRFETPWVEPKVFAIYVLDENGEADDAFRPILDGTLGDADDVFAMIAAYLRALGATAAAEIVVLADGAIWIWERTALLKSVVGLEAVRVTELVDWYHADEKLNEVAKAPAKWEEGQRHAWLETARTLLHAGDIEALMVHFDELAVGRRATEINDNRDYFRRNAARMQYAAARAAKLPLGSGAVESAIRRVVNLRMKNPGTFWRRENAEAMLLLRCYLKAGRLDELLTWSTCNAAAWWPLNQHKRTSPITEVNS
jgi:hypothetical protein